MIEIFQPNELTGESYIRGIGMRTIGARMATKFPLYAHSCWRMGTDDAPPRSLPPDMFSRKSNRSRVLSGSIEAHFQRRPQLHDSLAAAATSRWRSSKSPICGRIDFCADGNLEKLEKTG